MAAIVTKSSAAIARPLYSQVRDLLLSRIRSGEWHSGETLPNEFALASTFGVSIGTVRRAIEGLEELGIVVRKQGRGTYVAGLGPQALSEKFMPFRSPEGDHLNLKYQLLALKRRIMTDLEHKKLSPGASDIAIEVEQLAMAADRVVGHELSIMPADLFPKIETQLKYGQYLYDLFSDYGVLVTHVDDALSSAAEENYPEALRLGGRQHLLRIDRHSYTFDRRLVEIRRSLFDPTGLVYRAAHD